ncbi:MULTISPECIES: hypothetical protein [unclassified Clostridium]|uniref:hypothetical protein n=1 Tax=unclassified Clostridium TaxID=2614128 RepID=UPI0020795809|nr:MULTISPECIES: hypothetical protein [unclassified Clostridium]
MEFYEKTKVRNWNAYKGCQFGHKVWGHFEEGVFIDESYQDGDFPIVWCMHDDKACDAVLEEWCCIKQDHNED